MKDSRTNRSFDRKDNKQLDGEEDEIFPQMQMPGRATYYKLQLVLLFFSVGLFC